MRKKKTSAFKSVGVMGNSISVAYIYSDRPVI
jgi:hypothetical protein